MRCGERAGINESTAPGPAEGDQQNGHRRSDHPPRESAAARPQRRNWCTSGNRTAALSIGQRSALATAARAGTAPAALGFARFRFKHRHTFAGRAAMTVVIWTQTARFALARMTANPLLIRALVALRIEIGRW